MLDTRELILTEAAALLNRSGLADVSIRNVAAAASVGRSTVVHHFETKEGLLDALYLRALESFAVHIRAANFAPAFRADEQGRPSLQEMLNIEPDQNTNRESAISVNARFRKANPGSWEILRARRCPNFGASDAPVSFAAIKALAGQKLEAPVGPTVDLVIHQMLALQDWLAVASPEAVVRAVEGQPSTPYWASVFGMTRD